MRIRNAAAILVGVISIVALIPYERAGRVATVRAAEPATGSATSFVYLPFVINASASSTTAVSLQNIAYNPNAITIHVGTGVTWTNNEGSSFIQHTVTSGVPGTPSGTFDSPFLNSGQSFQFTFTSTGTFPYYCRVHGAAMTGTVTVVP